MACQPDLLCATLATLLVLLMTPHLCDATEVLSCSAGYSSSQLAKVSAFPPGTTMLEARTQLECATMCARQKNCLQVYFNDTAGLCYLISSGASLETTPSSHGRLLTIPNPMMLSGRSCSGVKCPSGSVCMSDCSTKFGGAMCAADNVQCPQDTHAMNVRHYYTSVHEDDSDSGIVHTVIFNKTRNDTAIRVSWFATTGAHFHAQNLCGRYYITFNGSQCTNPNIIDFSNYNNSYNDHHRFSELDGICYGLRAGVISVSIMVGACPNYTSSDSYTGWKANRSMWIYELNTAPITTNSQCSALPLMNTQFYSVLNLQGNLDPENLIMTMNYQKVASDTVLRVKWLGTARLNLPYDNGWCGRWYIAVNGVECSPRVEFVLGMHNNSFNSSRNNDETRTLEGFCYGLEAGIYSVALRVGSCYNRSAQPDTLTGCCGSVSRMTVSEVRMATSTQAVTTSDGTVVKLPFFNLQHWFWYVLDSDTNVGTVVNVTYNKLSDTSGLHMRAVGDARVYGDASCCRWYLTINGTECTNPGTVEGVSYTEQAIDYFNPVVVDGVCYGFTSGSYSIDFNVGHCPDDDSADCYTGWGSMMHVIVEEVQPDAQVACSNPLTCH